METPKVPAVDFAPSWLKVPSSHGGHDAALTTTNPSSNSSSSFRNQQQTLAVGSDSIIETSSSDTELRPWESSASLSLLRANDGQQKQYSLLSNRSNGSVNGGIGGNAPLSSSHQLPLYKSHDVDFTKKVHQSPCQTRQTNGTPSVPESFLNGGSGLSNTLRSQSLEVNNDDLLLPSYLLNISTASSGSNKIYNADNPSTKSMSSTATANRNFLRPNQDQPRRSASSRPDFREMANFQHHSRPSATVAPSTLSVGESLDDDADSSVNNPKQFLRSNDYKKFDSKVIGSAKTGRAPTDSSFTFNQDFPSLAARKPSYQSLGTSTETLSKGGANGHRHPFDGFQHKTEVVTNNTNFEAVAGNNRATVWDSAQAKSKVFNIANSLKAASLVAAAQKAKAEMEQHCSAQPVPGTLPSFRTLINAVPVMPLKKKSAKDVLGIGQVKVLPATLFSKSRGTFPTSSSASMEILVKNPAKSRPAHANAAAGIENSMRTVRTDSVSSKDEMESNSSSSNNSSKGEDIRSSLDAVSASEVLNAPEPDPVTKIYENLSLDCLKPKNGGLLITNTNQRTISLNAEDSLLSSSLEAEQRLLREMGWKGEDDHEDIAPLTEDEVREFKNLISTRTGSNARKSIQPRNSSNYRKNCSEATSNLSWPVSPKKIVTSSVVSPSKDPTDSSSSSEDDEDDDLMMG